MKKKFACFTVMAFLAVMFSSASNLGGEPCAECVDTVYVEDNVVCCMGDCEDDTVFSLTSRLSFAFNKMRNGKVLKRSIVDNKFDAIDFDGRQMILTYGADKFVFDMMDMPDTISVGSLFCRGKDVTEARIRRSMLALGHGEEGNILISLWLPTDNPDMINALKQFAMDAIFQDLVRMFEECFQDNYPITGFFDEPYIYVIGGSVEKMLKSTADMYCRLYEVTNGGSSKEPKPIYDYMFTFVPVWESADSRYLTYMAYSYTYAMGAHGYMERNYVTFDTSTGLMRTSKALFKPGTADEVAEMIGKRLAERRNCKKSGGNIERVDPFLFYEEGDLFNLGIFREFVPDRGFLPIPALTRDGCAFVYQPYEKGSFAEGVITVVLPYGEIAPLLADSVAVSL